MTPTWVIPAVFGALFAGYAIVRAARTLRRRAQDRAWAADIARKVRERNAEIARLNEQFAGEGSER